MERSSIEKYCGAYEYKFDEKYLVKQREDLRFKKGDIVRLKPLDTLLSYGIISGISLDPCKEILRIRIFNAYTFIFPYKDWKAPIKIVDSFIYSFSQGFEELSVPYDDYYYECITPLNPSYWIMDWMIEPYNNKSVRIIKSVFETYKKEVHGL